MGLGRWKRLEEMLLSVAKMVGLIDLNIRYGGEILVENLSLGNNG